MLLTEYRGLTVSDITELRRSLAEGGATFAVVKNTLMQRAAADASIEDLEALLEGPTAVAFVTGDPVAAAKKVVDAAKKFPALILKGGYMEGKVLSADEAKGLADLDSKEVMLSKFAGLLKGEMSRAASMFVSAQSKFLSLLEAYKEKVPDDSATEVAPAAEEPSVERLPRRRERKKPADPRKRPQKRARTRPRERQTWQKHPPPWRSRKPTRCRRREVTVAKMSTDELLGQFKEMTLLELSEFIKQFEEAFDVKAAAAGPVMMAAPGGGGAGGGEAEEEQSEFDVVLTGAGDKKPRSSRRCAHSPAWA